MSGKTPYFPTEVILNILLFVPAKLLHQAARYVCKQWYDIVSHPDFVTAHHQISPPGFLVQCNDDLHHVYHVDITDTATINVTELPIPVSATSPKILSSLNGLVLLSDLTAREILHVANPVTNVKVSLPPLVGLRDITAGLAVDSSGHYKVVVVNVSGEIEMRVFTIGGVDKAWRYIDLQGIPVNPASKESMLLRPHCFGGFIYWFSYRAKASSFGLAIDVDTETLHQFCQPQGVYKTNSLVSVVSMGTSLGFVQVKGYVWRLWKLTDVKSGEWTSLPEMNVRPLYIQLEKIFGCVSNSIFRPIRFFRGYLLLYRHYKKEYAVVCYNLANESIVFSPTKIKLNHRTILPHANTLVSPKNKNRSHLEC